MWEVKDDGAVEKFSIEIKGSTIAGVPQTYRYSLNIGGSFYLAFTGQQTIPEHTN